MTSSTPDLRPTHIRWRIVALVALITTIMYIDRFNLGVSGKYIQDEFGFSNTTLGFILSAFIFSYAIFQVPAGWLGDRFGPKGILTSALLWWSLFTAAVGIAPELARVTPITLAWSFALMRLLVGTGEAFTLP